MPCLRFKLTCVDVDITIRLPDLTWCSVIRSSDEASHFCGVHQSSLVRAWFQDVYRHVHTVNKTVLSVIENTVKMFSSKKIYIPLCNLK